jgi:hypothetical protein
MKLGISFSASTAAAQIHFGHVGTTYHSCLFTHKPTQRRDEPAAQRQGRCLVGFAPEVRGTVP